MEIRPTPTEAARPGFCRHLASIISVSAGGQTTFCRVLVAEQTHWTYGSPGESSKGGSADVRPSESNPLARGTQTL